MDESFQTLLHSLKQSVAEATGRTWSLEPFKGAVQRSVGVSFEKRIVDAIGVPRILKRLRETGLEFVPDGEHFTATFWKHETGLVCVDQKSELTAINAMHARYLRALVKNELRWREWLPWSL